jgi:hypothetical protein
VRTRWANAHPFALAALLLLGAATSQADSVTYSGSIALAPTNWNNSLIIPKFDSALGCLDNICFSLNGHVEGTAKFESLDGGPATVTMNLQSTLTLQRPDLSTLVVTIPLATTVDNVTAFDGIVDFAGTSGMTYSALAGSSLDTACSSTAADKALFTGAGNITLPCVGAGSSNGSGAGNLILQFSTSAAADAQVTYTYSPCVTPSKPPTWGSIKAHYR